MGVTLVEFIKEEKKITIPSIHIYINFNSI